MDNKPDARRAVTLFSALEVAIKSVRQQLGVRRQDLFRNYALKMQLSAFEAERAQLIEEFPELKVIVAEPEKEKSSK